MKFTSLSLVQYRNIASCSINLNNRHVVFTGENGQGKTNLLESLYLSCCGASFRTKKTNHLIQQTTGEASVSAEMCEQNEIQQVKTRIKPGSVSISVDQKVVKDRKELIESFPCIVFTHGDIEFVQGPPAQRRKFFDQTMCLYDTMFFDDIRRYNRTVRQRNQALKEQRSDIIPMYDSQLAQTGLWIQQKRSQVVEEFNQLFPQLFARVSGNEQPPNIVYRPSWKSLDSESAIREHLAAGYSRDLKLQTTASGPHRDRFLWMSGSSDYAETASTGQLRLISLVLRTAQAQYYRKKTGRQPVLLLDDVMLELDQKKRSAFLEELEGYEQAVFTFLPEEIYSTSGLFEAGITYRVNQGEIEE